MSGLVISTWDVRLMLARSSVGVSPSNNPWRTRLPFGARRSRNLDWSWASALAGNRYSALPRPVVQQRLEHGEVVAEALAAGRRRGHDYVRSPSQQADSLGLVRVERLDPERLQRRTQGPGQRGVQVAELGRSGRDVANVDDLAVVPGQAGQVSQEGGDVHARSEADDGLAVAVDQLQAFTAGLDIRQDPVDDLVGVPRAVAHAADAQGCELPRLVVANPR